MKKTIAKYRSYRKLINRSGVQPIGFIEWLQGRIAGKLEVAAAIRAKRRGDEESVKHAHLGMWAGNQRDGGMKLPVGLTHKELSDALKEGRVRVVIDKH